MLRCATRATATHPIQSETLEPKNLLKEDGDCVTLHVCNGLEKGWITCNNNIAEDKGMMKSHCGMRQQFASGQPVHGVGMKRKIAKCTKPQTKEPDTDTHTEFPVAQFTKNAFPRLLLSSLKLLFLSVDADDPADEEDQERQGDQTSECPDDDIHHRIGEDGPIITARIIRRSNVDAQLLLVGIDSLCQTVTCAHTNTLLLGQSWPGCTDGVDSRGGIRKAQTVRSCLFSRFPGCCNDPDIVVACSSTELRTPGVCVALTSHGLLRSQTSPL